MSGRRPWNRHPSVLQGNRSEQAQRSYHSNLATLPIPDWFDPKADKEKIEIWHEVLASAPEETLTPSDLHTFEAYVGIISQRRKMEKLLAKQKGTEADGMLVKRNGVLHPNPLMTAYRALLRDQATYASLLRLTGKRVRVNDSEAARASKVAESSRSARAGLMGGKAVANSGGEQ